VERHRRPRQESRTGRECQFCRNSDPNFGMRDPQDRLVIARGNDSAASHLTENGHVRHRVLEIRIRLAVIEGSLEHVA
jgi:hypothetical protein